MKKIVLLFLVFIMLFVLALPTFATTEGTIELSEDSVFLHIADVKDLSTVKNYSGVVELLIENSHITADAEILENETAEDVSFLNCTFDKNFKIPPKTKILSFEGNVPENLNNCANLKSIETISVRYADLKDLSVFLGFKNLKNIEFYDCSIGKISGIEKLKNLELVKFETVGIEEIDELKNLKNLKNLSLISTQVESLEAIENLKLEHLDVSRSTRIKNFDAVMNIKTLQTFYADNCQMALTKEFLDFLKNNNVDNPFSEEDLEIQQEIKVLSKKLFNKAMSTEEKIGRAVKYVCDLITYNEESMFDSDLSMEYNNHALKNALEGNGNCACYATLTAVLLQMADVECYQVSNTEHVWNLIEIDGYFYWLDVTWIDTLGTDIIGESPYYMADNSFLERHKDFSGQPYEANNEKLFARPYKQTMVFKLGEPLEEIIPDEEITEEKNNNIITIIIYVAVAVLICGAVVTVVFIKRKKD